MKYKTPRQIFEKYFTVQEERALLKVMRQTSGELAERDLHWITFARHTGVRVGVLSGMTCHDARDALLNDRFCVRGKINKGGKTYEIFLNKKARAALRGLLRVRRAMGFAEIADDALILTRRGEQISIRNLEDRMAGWVDKAKLQRGGSPHWLRHTLAKRIMKNSEAQDPRVVVMLALGHSDINSTVLYTLPDIEDMVAAMKDQAA